jgi:hypothetical protein
MEHSNLFYLARTLERGGCATRLQDPRTLEIYGVNLAEHYILTLNQRIETDCELVFVPHRSERGLISRAHNQ